ncbi:MAG TPA: thioredoxin [Patescibacteria group bacterium]
MSDNQNQPQGATHLTLADFQQHVDATKGENTKPLLVDFYADWCGPCQLAAPVIDKLADEFRSKITIAKLNVDEANEIASEHGVMSIPTVIIFKDGQEYDRKIGFPGEDGYRAMVEGVSE